MQVESVRAETKANEESKIEENLIEKMLKNLRSEWRDSVAVVPILFKLTSFYVRRFKNFRPKLFSHHCWKQQKKN